MEQTHWYNKALSRPTFGLFRKEKKEFSKVMSLEHAFIHRCWRKNEHKYYADYHVWPNFHFQCSHLGSLLNFDCNLNIQHFGSNPNIYIYTWNINGFLKNSWRNFASGGQNQAPNKQRNPSCWNLTFESSSLQNLSRQFYAMQNLDLEREKRK